MGLIPAHAGKTWNVGTVPDREGAHPRSRGENSISGLIVDRATGSSPLTRGKRRIADASFRRSGLIPAHAGKTGGSMGVVLSVWAHPRSRGENDVDECDRIKVAGSSPLTRGKLSLSVCWLVAYGLIPAHAGKTRCIHAR